MYFLFFSVLTKLTRKCRVFKEVLTGLHSCESITAPDTRRSDSARIYVIFVEVIIVICVIRDYVYFLFFVILVCTVSVAQICSHP